MTSPRHNRVPRCQPKWSAWTMFLIRQPERWEVKLKSWQHLRRALYQLVVIATKVKVEVGLLNVPITPIQTLASPVPTSLTRLHRWTQQRRRKRSIGRWLSLKSCARPIPWARVQSKHVTLLLLRKVSELRIMREGRKCWLSGLKRSKTNMVSQISSHKIKVQWRIESIKVRRPQSSPLCCSTSLVSSRLWWLLNSL